MWVTTVYKNPATALGPYLVGHALEDMLMTYLLQLSKFERQFNETSPIRTSRPGLPLRYGHHRAAL